MICAIEHNPMARQWRKSVCAINGGALRKNQWRIGRLIGFPQWRANGAMAHFPLRWAGTTRIEGVGGCGFQIGSPAWTGPQANLCAVNRQTFF
jgi:hypothetical protein